VVGAKGAADTSAGEAPLSGAGEFEQREKVSKKRGDISVETKEETYVRVTVCLALDCDDKRKEGDQKERKHPETMAHAKEGARPGTPF